MTTHSAITPLRALTAHRGSVWALAAGLTAWLIARLAAPDILPVARFLIAWDVGVLVYLITVFVLLRHATPADMARRAAEQRVARHVVLLISIAALIVSLAVIVFEIRAITRAPESTHGLLVAFVISTVALSWLFIHTSFATHYAFEYYSSDDGAPRRGGLEFPGGYEPGFWDIWNFSVVIGICFATADINITSPTIRRISTVHGICAFLFNTVLLAAAVSFAGAVFNPQG